MRTLFNIGVLLAGFIIFTASVSMAQETAQTITVTGHASAKPKPELLRMTLVITQQGSDVRAAVASLQQRRDDLKTKLIATGASADSIKFSDPIEGAETNLTPQQRMMQQYMAMSHPHQTPTTAPSVTISSTLTAQWPLTDAAPDDALIAASQLISKIKDNIGKPAVAGKTPEEQEVAEEMNAAAAQQNPDQPKTDEPAFVFVHKMSDAERTKLLEQAFNDAQAQANRLAAATGMHLGPVVHLSTSTSETEGPGNMYVEAMMAETGAAPPPSDDEATGPQRNDVNYTVTLAATFKLQ